MASRLVCRRIERRDEEELIKMRRACGWGEDRVPSLISSTLEGSTTIMYIFYLSSSDDESEPVGMGGLVLSDSGGQAGGLQLADAREGKVLISGLFVYPKFQGGGFGREIVRALEEIGAKEHGARIITIRTKPFNEDGSVNRTLAWYVRLGYQEFLARRPVFTISSDPAVPLALAAFLFKRIEDSYL